MNCRMHEVLNKKTEHTYAPCPRPAEIGNRITGKLYCTPCWERHYELTYPSTEESNLRAADMDLQQFIEWYWSTHIMTGPMTENGQFDDFPYTIWSAVHPWQYEIAIKGT